LPDNRNDEKILRYIGFLIGFYGKSNPMLKGDLEDLYRQVKAYQLDIAIEELSQMYLRNGSFPGDMVGWSEDDLLTDGDEDDSKDKT
jgi:hypothetical protein